MSMSPRLVSCLSSRACFLRGSQGREPHLFPQGASPVTNSFLSRKLSSDTSPPLHFCTLSISLWAAHFSTSNSIACLPRLSAVMLLSCLFPARGGQSAFLISTWQMLSPEARGRGELRGSAGKENEEEDAWAWCLTPAESANLGPSWV